MKKLICVVLSFSFTGCSIEVSKRIEVSKQNKWIWYQIDKCYAMHGRAVFNNISNATEIECYGSDAKLLFKKAFGRDTQ